MDERELYEKQYGEKILVNRVSFQRLRRIFKKFDRHREDLALDLIDYGERMLDVGCGSGSLLFRAKTNYRELYGIDIVSSRIEEARIAEAQAHKDNASFFFSVCNINERLDFPDSYFDAITAIAVIEHVFDPYEFVSELCRTLKRGGIFVAQVPNIAYIRHRLRLLFGKLPVTSSPFNWREIGWDGGHLHYFNQEAFCDLLKECGFMIMKVCGSGLFANIRNIYPRLLTGDICVKAKKL